MTELDAADAAPAPPASNAISGWHALLAQWRIALTRRDIAAISALFAEDALFQGLSPTLLVGRDAIPHLLALLQAHFKKNRTGSVRFGFVIASGQPKQ